ncbi:MAG: response regulator transcription factor [Pseudomonadota bacterium]
MELTILLIDDDEELCQLLADFLRLESFRVEMIHDGTAAVELARQRTFDAIVLDIMLPGLNGLEVLRQLRTFSETPVLMLTARGEDTDRIIGLEMGADDYLPKPCNPRELAARLRAVLRRAQPPESDKRELVVGKARLHAGRRCATYGGNDLALTSAEFNVLRLLMSDAGSVVDKDSLCEGALGRPLSAYDRSIDVHISKLRKKLATQGAPELIVSVRGVGYQYLDTGDGD